MAALKSPNVKLVLFSLVTFTLVFGFVLYIVLTGKMFDILFHTPLSPYGNFVSIPKSRNCNNDLWKHVYSPGRLFILDKCITVTGTIVRIERESDGDDHILLKVDSTNPKLTNIFNQVLWKDSMVLEIICKGNPGKDAKKACEGYTNKLESPVPGSHVKVNGSFVVDKPYGWTEIHPVSSIVKL